MSTRHSAPNPAAHRWGNRECRSRILSRPATLKGIAIGSYFNPNLADYVKLPAVLASYAVHVEYGGFQSNAVKIEVARE
ncbi:MAG: hypothetical protein HC889_09940 [Synechococcaceae cyanobacterium SM1_2_3]|nr:hypothetical protein [Synechococcaceae cyanobacterium SM1_2_3]